MKGDIWTIKDPLIELLAIKLYEHDHQGLWPQRINSWMAIAEEDREAYREMARGEQECTETERDFRPRWGSNVTVENKDADRS
jgi:hypothetical protein